MHCHPCVSEGYRMSRTDTPPDASAPRVIAPTSSYCCPGPKPAALWPMRQGWSSTRGLVPRAGESGRLLHRGGMDTQTGFGARTWALRLSCGVVVEAVEKALCDRISGLVRMVRSPCRGSVPSQYRSISRNARSDTLDPCTKRSWLSIVQMQLPSFPFGCYTNPYFTIFTIGKPMPRI